MKYQELIPEWNILALIVHEIICSGLNHNNNLIKIPNPGNSRYTDYLSVYWFKIYGNFAEKNDFFLLNKVMKLVGGGSVINGTPWGSSGTQANLGHWDLAINQDHVSWTWHAS